MRCEVILNLLLLYLIFDFADPWIGWIFDLLARIYPDILYLISIYPDAFYEETLFLLHLSFFCLKEVMFYFIILLLINKFVTC